MNRAQAERIYGMRELTRILTLTPRRTAQLRRLLLLHGDSGYTFRDLLALRAARSARRSTRCAAAIPGCSSRWPRCDWCWRAAGCWRSPIA